jgi:hypothetical protein
MAGSIQIHSVVSVMVGNITIYGARFLYTASLDIGGIR